MVNQALERGERLISDTTSLFTRYKFLRYCFIRGIGSRLWRAGTSIPVPPPGPHFDRAQRPLNGLRGRLNRALRQRRRRPWHQLFGKAISASG